MDPLVDLFSFIKNNDLKEEKEAVNLLNDSNKNIKAQSLELTKNEKRCKLFKGSHDRIPSPS